MVRSRLLREGLVGVFILVGIGFFSWMIFFLKDSKITNQDYQVKLLFENAGGLREGAKVYYRGVPVGRVMKIAPSSNGVEVSTEIDGNLQMPQNLTISTLRAGLLGEVSVNIVPNSDIQESAKKINPLEKECLQQKLIVCNNQQINAKTTPDLVESLSLLAEKINDEDFVKIINETLINVNEATIKMSALTDDISVAVAQLNRSLKTVSRTTEKIGNTADSFTNTANVASTQLETLGNTYADTGVELKLLANNLNQLIDDNKSDLSSAIVSFNKTIVTFNKTTEKIGTLANNTDKLVSQVAPEDVAKISQNLGTTTENLALISKDLQNIAQELNNPTNLVTLQQTLDSARVTFANTAKITSDIDEFTGDPEFRNNLKKLIDGLSTLVSYSETLDKQVKLAQILQEVEKVEQVKAKENKSISIDKNLQKDLKSQPFPTALSSGK